MLVFMMVQFEADEVNANVMYGIFRVSRGAGIVTECSSMKEAFVHAAKMNYLLLCSAGPNPQILDLTCS